MTKGEEQEQAGNRQLVPAATAVLARDGGAGDSPEAKGLETKGPETSGSEKNGPETNGIEVLMVLRSDTLRNFRGMWVFPGGRIDPADHAGAAGIRGAALNAAVRETAEETGLVINAEELFPLSRWTAPEGAPKRFDTWFFVGVVEREQEVIVDGAEIMEHRWVAPAEVLAEHAAGELKMMPPTFVSLMSMARFDSCADLRTELLARGAFHFAPRVSALDGALHFLYAGDAGYEAGNASAEGPRHRCVMVDGGLADGGNLSYINEVGGDRLREDSP